MDISYDGLLQCIYHTMDYSDAYNIQWMTPMHISYNVLSQCIYDTMDISYNGYLIMDISYAASVSQHQQSNISKSASTTHAKCNYI